MEEQSVEELLRSLARESRSATATLPSPALRLQLAVRDIERSLTDAANSIQGAEEREYSHIETAFAALSDIWDSIAAIEAAEAAERLWEECAEVAQARLAAATQGIETLENSLRQSLTRIRRSPQRDYVVSLLLDALDRALGQTDRSPSTLTSSAVPSYRRSSHREEEEGWRAPHGAEIDEITPPALAA